MANEKVKVSKAGRKKSNPPVYPTLVRMTRDQMKLLRMWGHGDMAAGLRWLIDTAAPMIKKAGEKEAS